MGLIKKLLFVFVLLVLIVLISSSALAKDFGKVKLNNVYADVEFLEDVSDSSKDVSELKQKIEVSPNSVNIDTKKYPNLNKKAKITFKNSYFKGTPLVIYNNQISQVTPTMVGLGQWQITVDGFSSWQLIDSSWGGTFTGGTSQNNYSWGNITHDSLMLQGDSKVSINMSMPTSGGGIKDLSFYYRNVSVSGATYYQTTNPLSRTAGSYKFDGINDAMNIQWHGALDFYGKDITIGAWINISKNSYNTITVVSSVGMPSTAGSGWIIYEQDSGSGYVLGFTHTDGGEHDSFSSQSIEFDKWNYWIFQYNISSGTGRSCINNNCTIWTQSNAAILAPDTTGIWNIGRRTSGSQRNMNGSITEYRAWNRLLQPKEFANMYNNSHYYRFLANGSYITIEHNATDYTENQVNVWTNISIQNLKTIRAEQVAVYGRAGTCGALSGAWTEGTPYLAGHFTFSGGLQGKCFEANITISSYGTNLSSVWSNYTINSTKYVMPNATNLNISGGDNTSTNITGNATYSLNDTDGGGILQIGWYVNGVLNSRENFTGLSNGSISVFSLDNSNFVKNDIVNYNVTPFNSLATGNIIQSSFITIGNANFSYSYTPNNTDTISLQKPLGRAFTITFLSDVDNDAEVTWYVDGTQQTVADTFTLRSGLYGDYDILSIVANVSDGHNNMTTSWKVDLTPASVQMVGSIAIALFILFVTGGLFLLPFKKKFSDNHISDMILKRGCWTIGIYLMMLNASIMATIASSSGIDLTQEMFRYMWLFGWAGWLFIGFTVLKTLFDVIKMWKVDKENKRMGG
jgi:hypothetical protein